MYAVAKVDQNWGTPTRCIWPQGQAPISHVVNARTQEGYTARNEGHVIRGQVWWASAPRCVQLGERPRLGGGGGGAHNNDVVVPLLRGGRPQQQ